jgi:hypothetical protein
MPKARLEVGVNFHTTGASVVLRAAGLEVISRRVIERFCRSPMTASA